MTELKEAVALLRDDHLVWSEDFEHVREALADLLARLDRTEHSAHEEVTELVAQVLHADRLTSRIPDALEEWVKDGARQLGVYEHMASRSEAFRDVVRRLFNNL